MNIATSSSKLVICTDGCFAEKDVSANYFNSEQSVYEVIRLIGGKVLFIEDHFERLKASANVRGFNPDLDLNEFKQKIAELSAANLIRNGNVKFVMNVVDGKPNWMFSFIPHQYPSETDYRIGVPVGLLFAERENPTAKLIQNTVREKANKLMKDENLYEVLLVDKAGRITEGSRSNVFFVKDSVFYTAPSQLVLNGITRIKILQCLINLGFVVHEKAVNVDEMNEFDAAFITGTSPKVLPISRIGEVKFQSENVFVQKLMEAYNLLMDLYLSGQK